MVNDVEACGGDEKLKMTQISETLDALNTLEPSTLDKVYSVISQVWA